MAGIVATTAGVASSTSARPSPRPLGVARLKLRHSATSVHNHDALFESDVGRGYDIESSWPGEERCIEVKSTTRLGSDIYLSENERVVLEGLADNAWLYRVLVTLEGGAVVGEPLRNPIQVFQKSGMTTAVWRVTDPSAD